ncbi:MAG: flippase-like domain-containing protein [Bacteroidaceae bacterium]|nr:flippase-like domain-containing protein [Bacteroidaceae bacterium]
MEGTKRKKMLKRFLQVVFPLLLGTLILVWVYRDFNFQRVGEVLFGGMNYAWMLFSLVFGVTAAVFRGYRWKLALEPLGEYPKTANCVYAIFISYASSLIIPRVGEVTRCGILAKYDNVSFSKSLGTVVSERMVDTLCMGLLSGLMLLLQLPVFLTFFAETGTNVNRYVDIFTSGHFYLIILCLLAVFILAVFLIWNIALFAKLKGILLNVWQGFIALKDIRHIPLYIICSLGIWVSYFLEFYLAFYAFGFSADLGVTVALTMFVVGTFAVIVPTPNGAGPWHFAVMTMMMLYGVGKEDAGIFALLVHGIQTFLLILLGIYGLLALPFTNKLK